VSKKLYVGNLAFTATEDDLRNAFAAYTTTSAKIITDRETGRSRGFAFVEVEDGDKAITEMNGKDLAGRKLTVNEAREREPRGPRQGGSGGGYRQDDRQGGGYNRY
jgi:RNA recognition motif-containing protein